MDTREMGKCRKWMVGWMVSVIEEFVYWVSERESDSGLVTMTILSSHWAQDELATQIVIVQNCVPNWRGGSLFKCGLFS